MDFESGCEGDESEDILFNESDIVEKEGFPIECCPKCHAIMWKEERQGQIKLPPTPPTPSYLKKLYSHPKRSRAFKRYIRLYNSMFAFTSIGSRVDRSINSGKAPYVYRLNGQNHHIFGSRIPNEGDKPKFYQLYVYDTEHEVDNRMKWLNVNDGYAVDSDIVGGLLQMLDETNELVKKFRKARDRFKDNPVKNFIVKLKVCHSKSGRKNNIGPSDEVAGVMVGDDKTTNGERDIIIEKHNNDLERVSSVYPKLMALQYPILFPLGEDSYHDEISYVYSEMQTKKKRKRITMKEYYSYKLEVRKDEDLNGNIDGVVSAEIPDPLIDPAGYVVVKYNEETYFDQSGFPIYKRQNTGITVQKGKCTLDNAFVVPYNRDLLVKYQCHMNMEICCHTKSLKYLFKYCLKGHDRATIEITNQRNKNNDAEDGSVDEISVYFDGRCTLTKAETVKRVIRREKNKHSQLEAFFLLNSEDPSARPYTYDEIPQYYIWNETDGKWTVRKKGRQIGRLLYTHHSSCELWYLRMLLSNVRGPTSFESLRTVNGVRYKSFKDAFQSYGLLDDDNE
ncbi:uncharacterized protein LOC141691400 [Apium graveolens]|uniref:uncharacterized protein LOC141691400 n=1 Tax=Apium graveolens TaxID=4045 RepID=UPI003D797AF9